MPPRLRRLLPAFAVIATALALPPATSVTSAAASNAAPRAADPRLPRLDPQPLSRGQLAALHALDQVGVPYHWGGESPASGFDCSGLVRWAYGRLGIDLPHNSYALFSVGRRVPESRIAPGDVLFFTGLGHVGLYVGDGWMVHAPYSGKNVEVTPLGGSHYGRRLIGARRVA
jgi:cell wall-associated NlpC family hydrolase